MRTKGRHKRRTSRPTMLAVLLIAAGVFSGAAASSTVAEATPSVRSTPRAASLHPAAAAVGEPMTESRVLGRKITSPFPAGTAALPVALDPLLAEAAVWKKQSSSVEMAMVLTREEFPALPDESGEGRRVVYSNSQQRVWLVDTDGVVLDSYLVSGRRNTPRPGTYQVFSKSKLAYSYGGITMRHMVRFAWGSDLAIGFHEIPRYASGRPLQTDDQLGTFRSAGCVRQEAVNAARLYLWADIGTTVVVTP